MVDFTTQVSRAKCDFCLISLDFMSLRANKPTIKEHCVLMDTLECLPTLGARVKEAGTVGEGCMALPSCWPGPALSHLDKGLHILELLFPHLKTEKQSASFLLSKSGTMVMTQSIST